MNHVVRFYVLILLGLAFSNTVWGQYKQNLVNKTRIITNHDNILPIKGLVNKRIALVTTDPHRFGTFITQVERYAEVATFDFSNFDEDTKYYNTVIVGVGGNDLKSKWLTRVSQAVINNKEVIVAFFGDHTEWSVPVNNYSILKVNDDSQQAQRNMAMTIFGGMGATNVDGVMTEQTRLQYTYGESSGLDLLGMERQIDDIAEEAIREKATPGMVVMLVKNGQVMFEKSYGYHTYERREATKTTDIFDLASVSKIAGTTPVIMHLQEREVVHLDSTIGRYLWKAKKTNKENITLRTVLLHEAGFTPYIPFYRFLKGGDMQRFRSESHQTKVADSAYLINNYYQDVMWPQMMESDVKPIGEYVYSDISMYVMQEVAEHETSQPMDELVEEILYKPIGMKTAGYNPRNRFDKSKIVPTEYDTSFRKVLLEGYVHDQGAAMAGGVAGHAGLFASANDLAIYAQMLLNRGEYGGERYFQPETVDLFTSKQSLTSRRGLGFDRWDPNPKNEYPSKWANSSVFGHTGYTGTCIWIDPKNQLTYIFLSNRVHPQVSTKLLNLNIRSRIQDVIYETISDRK